MLSHSQNYINNKALVRKVLQCVDFKEADLVLEVGPGKGIITDELTKVAKEVVAVEADRVLAESLRLKYKNQQNLNVIDSDFLKYRLPDRPFIVVSNIPFNITADIVRKITAPESKLKSAYIIMQKEAGVKFLGAPHAQSPLLSHLLKINFEIKYLMDISRSNYTPSPKSNTVLILIQRRTKTIFDHTSAERFRDFIVYIFERKKPLIKESLKSVMSNLQIRIGLENIGVPVDREVKKLLFREWVNLYHVFVRHASERSKSTVVGAYSNLLNEQSKLKKVHRTRKDF